MNTLQRMMPSSSTFSEGCTTTTTMGFMDHYYGGKLVHRIEDDSDGDVNVTIRPAKRCKYSPVILAISDEEPFSHPLRRVSDCSGDASTYTAALKYRDYNRSWLAWISSQRKQRVHFQDTVQIKEIPSHRDYSDEVRTQIWAGMREIQANAVRNELELFRERQTELLLQQSGCFSKSSPSSQKQDEKCLGSPPLRRIAKVSSSWDLSSDSCKPSGSDEGYQEQDENSVSPPSEVSFVWDLSKEI